MMKKSIFIIIILVLFFLGCEDDVLYQTEFDEKSILYCIINADSSNQFAMLKRNFRDKNSTDNHYVKNASINLISNNETVEMLDTSTNTNNVATEFYYTNNFKPYFGKEIKINAELPNGRTLSSSVIIPNFSLFAFERSILFIPASDDPTRLFVGWSLRNANDNLSFLTRLTIVYNIKKGDIETEHVYVIPVEYVIKNDNKLPIYPTTIRTSSQIYKQSIINSAFAEISSGDTSKSSYTIKYANFEVFIMEENLANYSASIESFKNSYSVKVYEPTISNIDGGVGVFGAFVKRSMKIIIEKDYVESFGYRYVEQE